MYEAAASFVALHPSVKKTDKTTPPQMCKVMVMIFATRVIDEAMALPEDSLPQNFLKVSTGISPMRLVQNGARRSNVVFARLTKA